MAATNMSNFGGQNVMLMRNDMSRSDSLVAMLSSCNPHVGFQVPRSVGGLEDAIVGCGQKRPYYSTFDGAPPEELEDGDDGGDDGSQPVEKKRRLTFDQVRSLERNFEMENKLEPERKMQLAKELGLQPRQVAVWFQNRRARWKTKQLEQDYEMLNSGYNKLKADLEIVLREKAVLKAEVQRLSGKTRSRESQGCQSVDSSQCESETTVHPSHCIQAAGESAKTDKKSEPVATKEHHTRTSPNIDVAVTDKEKEKEQTTSSGSNSSELLDADSPRATDTSNLSRIPEGPSTYCQQFAPENFVGPNLLQVDDDLCNRDVPQPSYPVKLENGCGFQFDPTCVYFLPQIDEHSVLPWWDWP